LDDLGLDERIITCGDVGWMGIAHARDQWQTVVNTVLDFLFPYKAGNFLTS
jgi:hypothetical protein